MCLISTGDDKRQEEVNLDDLKRQFKSASQYSLPFTLIHGKIYNLTNFNHPGGHVAIELAYGRDATEMFESMHQLTDKSKLGMILKKYEASPSEQLIIKNYISPSGIFDWEATINSEFTKELSATAKIILKDNDKITVTRLVEVVFFFLLSLWQFYHCIRGTHLALIGFPLAFWVFTVNLFHDGSHFAVSKIPVINHICSETAFLFSTPYTWYHQHIIGHHCFPNVIGKDPDLYHSPKFTRCLSVQSSTSGLEQAY